MNNRFVVPCLLVISNDTFAYIFGFFFGKTRLIELSPKKTVEGFLGGMFSTFVFAILVTKLVICKSNINQFSSFFQQFPSLVCPKHEISLQPFELTTCQISDIFVPAAYSVPDISFLGTLAI